MAKKRDIRGRKGVAPWKEDIVEEIEDEEAPSQNVYNPKEEDQQGDLTNFLYELSEQLAGRRQQAMALVAMKRKELADAEAALEQIDKLLSAHATK